ncbi:MULTISPECIES: hypothetical protein [Staphylococcus]|uniref:hypothetical protein n=1 Tax=Staphylococcus TaxID=1279 RepID=UPI00159F352C|nr:hypothetical protein [Staphylococcus equorum]MDK9845239.1 hypothetical protein [Staphylococcus equorum]MDK9849073.1 hypothetical protein [Staphylococcus equorum]MDK9854381.1 hypothetical protein [Staphylococcus equorum]
MTNSQEDIEKAVLQSRLFEEIQRSVKLQTELEATARELEAYKSQVEHNDE